MAKEEQFEITDDIISEALSDYTWQITEEDTVLSYAKNVAEKLGIDPKRVANIIKSEAPEKITDDTKMSKLVWGE